MPIRKILLNTIDFTKFRTGFVDRYSHMCLSVGRNAFELAELSPRGLVDWRDPMTGKLLSLSGAEAEENEFLPWSALQCGPMITSTLMSPAFNVYSWIFEIDNPSSQTETMTLNFTGNLLKPEKNHLLKKCGGGIVCSFNTDTNHPKILANPGYFDADQPVWSLRSSMFSESTIDQANCSYTFKLEPITLEPEKHFRFAIQLDYENANKEKIESWAPGPMYTPEDACAILPLREAEWTARISAAYNGAGDRRKILRAAAVLNRCGCDWDGVIANFCSVTSWASTAFMWDSIVSAAGLMQLDVKLAQDAILAIFLRQREDGCIPTHSYQHADGSTFYPQASIGGWAVVHMLEYGADDTFLTEILPKLDKLHQWYVKTQDHDRDGLPEWRFSGQAADNSPVYDRYAAHIQKDLATFWNIYLPPVASVSMAGFLIMDAKCLAHLYDRIGGVRSAGEYRAEAAFLEERLNAVCLGPGGLYHDYDHHLGCFNEVLTLYNFLPLWAGVKIDETQARAMIEEYLLSEAHFNRELPLPFLAYSEEAYRPDGYWRGRIWPHVSYWMLELLWSYGYEAEADGLADRLLAMMDRSPEILENYFSDPAMPGGGEVDYSWSCATFLNISNRLYRRPVLGKVMEGRG